MTRKFFELHQQVAITGYYRIAGSLP